MQIIKGKEKTGEHESKGRRKWKERRVRDMTKERKRRRGNEERRE